MQRMKVCVASLSGLVAVLLAGCTGGPRRANPPAYSSVAGAAALRAYDTNGDGAIGDAEFDQVPALRASRGQVDADGDGRLTAAEIDARVTSWRNSRIAEMPVRCEVTWDGEPLVDARVVFEPEPFLGPELKPAEGGSAEDGTAGMTLASDALANPRYPGVAPGWYKIRVTSISRAIPDHYNTATTLGCEVAMDAHWVNHGAVELKLQSR
jgi:hypothetical protein